MNIILNIALGLPNNLKKEMKVFSNNLNGLGDLVQKLDENRCPHLTLYSSVFPEEAIEQLQKKLKDIAENNDAPTLHINGISERRGHVAVSFKQTSDISNLHREIVEKISTLRIKESNIIITNKLEGSSAEEKELLNKYGSRNIFERFSPHISLAEFRDPLEGKGASQQISPTKKQMDSEWKCETLEILKADGGWCESLFSVKFTD